VKGRRHSPAVVKSAVASRRAGEPVTSIAKKHGVHISVVYRWLRNETTSAGRSAAAKKGHAARAAKAADTTDVTMIVDELLASLRPALVDVVGRLVNLGVERKLDETKAALMAALMVAP